MWVVIKEKLSNTKWKKVIYKEELQQKSMEEITQFHMLL